MNIINIIDTNSQIPVLHEIDRNHNLHSLSSIALVRLVNNLSLSLLKHNLKKGDLVLIISENTIEMIESILSVINIGAIAVPLSPNIGTNAMLSILKMAKPIACILGARINSVCHESLSERCDLIIAVDSNESCNAKVLYFDNLINGENREHQIFKHLDTDPAVIFFTSGSTGEPKAICRTHGVLNKFVECFYKYHEKDPYEDWRGRPQILVLPLSHIGGFNHLLLALAGNREVYFMKHFDPSQYLTLASKIKLDSMILIPSMYSILLKDKLLDELDLTSIRYCFIGGEACPETVLDKIGTKLGALAIPTYGTTECMSGIGYTPAEKRDGKIVKGSCGKQLFGELKLLDDDQESDSFGELWVRNETVEECYLDEKLNKSRFSGGWYKTGDIFFKDEQGYFFWRGRADDMFVCKGNNIYPLEVENLMLKHPAVDAAIISPIKNVNGETIIAASVIRKEDVSENDLIKYMLKYAPSYSIPQFVTFARALPCVGVGKYDRPKILETQQAAYLAKSG